ncbi:MAG: hypothetical protein KDH20_17920 [Rhodocyclaceae bacterium]|nr:hypothetical protein [Rhodocyclaceae bacterium]
MNNVPMNEFLKVEYEQCLGLIKFYDERHQSLAKFAAGLSAAVPAFVITILRFGPQDIQSNVALYAGFLCAMTTLGLLIVFISMVQNRLYFVYPARQVNSIRALMAKALEPEGFDNRMYTASDFSAWKWMSSQTLLLFFVAAQAGVFFGLSVFFSLGSISSFAPSSRWLGFTGGVALAAFIFYRAARYLATHGGKPADSAVHGANK